VAELLGTRGKQVEIVTGRPSIIEPNLIMWRDVPFVMPRLDELNVKITPLTAVKEITDKGAICFYVFSDREDRAYEIEADNIIMVTTKLSNLEPYNLLKQRGVECHLIGDAKAPRWIMNATHDGYKVGREI
jgi:hypothetical protein